MLRGRAPLCRALVHVVGSGERERTNLILSLLKSAFEKDMTKVEKKVHVGFCRGASMQVATNDEHLDGAIGRCFLKVKNEILKSRVRRSALQESVNTSQQNFVDSDVQCLLSEGIDMRLLCDCCQLTNDLATVVDKLDTMESMKSKQESECNATEAAINFIQHATIDSFFAIHLALLGQSVDYPTSLYMLVFKLSQLVGKQSKLSNADNSYDALSLAGRAIQLSIAGENEEAVDGMGTGEEVAYPPMAIVGTHTGEADVQLKIDNYDRIVNKVVKEVSCHENVIKPNKQVASLRHLKDTNRHKASMFFCVDITKAGREVEDTVAIELRERIVAMIRTFWSERVREQPMRWHCYEKVLKALRKQLHKGRCSLSAARLLAKSLCCMPNSHEVESVLRYLRSFGSVLYYPEWKELQDIVFINPPWLVNVMTTFVIGKDVASHLQHHWDLARLRGLLTVPFVQFLLYLSEVSVDDFSDMIQILRHFGFLFPFTSFVGTKSILQGYFAPFLTTAEFSGPPAFKFASSNFPPPLVFMADDGGLLLEPLFLRLTGHCLEHFPKRPELKRNRCVFHTPDGLNLELYYSNRRYIITTLFTIDTSTASTDLKRCCLDLRHFLQEQLESVKMRGMAGLRLQLCLLDVSKLNSSSVPLNVTRDSLVPLDKSQLPNSELWKQQQEQEQQQQQQQQEVQFLELMSVHMVITKGKCT